MCTRRCVPTLRKGRAPCSRSPTTTAVRGYDGPEMKVRRRAPLQNAVRRASEDFRRRSVLVRFSWIRRRTNSSIDTPIWRASRRSQDLSPGSTSRTVDAVTHAGGSGSVDTLLATDRSRPSIPPVLLVFQRSALSELRSALRELPFQPFSAVRCELDPSLDLSRGPATAQAPPRPWGRDGRRRRKGIARVFALRVIEQPRSYFPCSRS